MEKSGEYIIPVKGLDIGVHRFRINIGNSFFESMDFADIKKGDLTLNLSVEKESNLMVFNFKLSGTVNVQCDRCLDYFDQNIAGNFKLIFKNSDHYEEITDEVINIPSEESRIDISRYLFEFINLMIPIKKVHANDEFGNSTCNPEMLEKLEEYKVRKESPQWKNALKSIKLE